jgi:hypothetical protein
LETGNGWDIRIGVDPLIGAQSFYKLSMNLISTLHTKGIKLLAQVASPVNGVLNISSWKSAEMLGLAGEQKEEWENYVKGLNWSGFELNDETDTLVWSWDTKGGQVNAKQAYEVQCLDDHELISKEWFLDLWNWQLPLRIQLFCWLMFENRILTWDNLSKRGLIGPSRCVLCGEREESLNHLMVDCLFTKEVWKSILNELSFTKRIGEEDSYVNVFRFGSRRWSIGNNYLALFVGRFGNIEI